MHQAQLLTFSGIVTHFSCYSSQICSHFLELFWQTNIY